jgi:hypothetical protein
MQNQTVWRMPHQHLSRRLPFNSILRKQLGGRQMVHFTTILGIRFGSHQITNSKPSCENDLVGVRL